MRVGRSVPAFLFLVFAALPLFAITYADRADRDLIHDAAAIVIATGQSSYSQLASDGRIVTICELRIDEVIKGEVEPGRLLRLTEPGGIVGQRMLGIPGAPRYDGGARYLVFTRETGEGEITTLDMGLGRFAVREELSGREVARRSDGDADAVGSDVARGAVRDLQKFVRFIREVVGGGEPKADYFVDPEPSLTAQSRQGTTLANPGDYLMADMARWQAPTASFHTRGTQPGFANSGLTAAANAASAWTSAGGAVNYSIGATTTASGGLAVSDGVSSIQFNDPNGFVAAHCTGCVAIGGFWVVGTHTADGQTFYSITEADVEMGRSNSRMSENDFQGIITHEIGHTLAFRHSNLTPDNESACASPSPCADIGAAIMASTYVSGMGASLRQWDRDAVTTVYPASKMTRRRAVRK